MKDQHTLIKGYRDLTQDEISLMNEIKSKGEELRDLISRVELAIKDVPPPPAGMAHEADHPEYWLRYADGTLRTGLMHLTRAVARPLSY